MNLKFKTVGALLLFSSGVFAQNPAVTSWLINTTGITASHYVNGNSTPINDTEPANVQTVQYSSDYAYISCSGLPAYVVGPYLDNNPATATNNNNLYKIPKNPTPATPGNETSTPMGQNGVFINGVAFYNYADGVSYSQSTGADAGGPLGGSGDGIWNRNAVLAEQEGFDCSKGHPSPIGGPGGGGGGGTIDGFYHHHQNPTAFDLGTLELSDICDLYAADGLYTIDPNQHSPLIGFAFDGYPVYGAYGYDNTDGTGRIVRIESSYQVTTTTTRANGPAVSATYPVGWYKEDFTYVAGSGHLDDHNGRFCVTPEYPNGTYCYFATVDSDWNSAYPYLVGPTYYGEVESSNFAQTSDPTITETVSTYDPANSISENNLENLNVTVFPNPASNIVAVQIGGILMQDINVKMYDLAGKIVKESKINQGSTIWHIDTRTLYAGQYIIKLSNGEEVVTKKVTVLK